MKPITAHCFNSVLGNTNLDVLVNIPLEDFVSVESYVDQSNPNVKSKIITKKGFHRCADTPEQILSQFEKI